MTISFLWPIESIFKGSVCPLTTSKLYFKALRKKCLMETMNVFKKEFTSALKNTVKQLNWQWYRSYQFPSLFCRSCTQTLILRKRTVLAFIQGSGIVFRVQVWEYYDSLTTAWVTMWEGCCVCFSSAGWGSEFLFCEGIFCRMHQRLCQCELAVCLWGIHIFHALSRGWEEMRGWEHQAHHSPNEQLSN